MTDEEWLEIMAAAHIAFSGLPGFISVALGRKMVGNTTTEVPAVRILLAKKLPASEVPSGQLVPPHFRGVATDVQERPELLHIRAATKGEQLRPIVGGCQIESDNGVGTAGCIVRRQSDGKICLLTNQHVVSSGKSVTTGGSVWQPSSPCCSCFGGSCAKPIGRVVDIKLSDFVDCALIALNPHPDPDASPGDPNRDLKYKAEVFGIGPIRNFRAVTPTDAMNQIHVVKQGIFGNTEGIIAELVAGPVPVSDGDGGVLRTARNFFSVVNPVDPINAPFSQAGDSGSLVVEKSTSFALGLMDGGFVIPSGPMQGWDVTTVNRIELVQGALGADVVLTASGNAPEVAVPANNFQGVTPLDADGNPTTVELEQRLPEVQQLERDLLRTERGQELLQAFLRHRPEIIRLMQTEQRVLATWQRNRGPAWVATLLDLTQAQQQTVPDRLHGRTLQQSLDAVLKVLDKYGSAELREDVAKLSHIRRLASSRDYQDAIRRLEG